jgi:uncharacterized membrane protein/protein-disulfide isomerase
MSATSTRVALERKTPSRRGWIWASLGSSLVGLAASGYLAVLHWKVHNVPGHVSFCAVNDRVNCDTVAMSSYSVVAGLPLAVWGGLYYLVILACVGRAWRRADQPRSWELVTVLSHVAVGVSCYLLLLSELVIHSYCLLCLTVYTVNLIQVILAVLARRCLGHSLRSGVNLLLASLLLSVLVFIMLFSDCLAASFHVPATCMVVFAALLIVLNRAPSRSLVELRALLAASFQDVASLFHGGLRAVVVATLALAVLLGLELALPQLYSRDAFADRESSSLRSLGVEAPCDDDTSKPDPAMPTLAGGLTDIGHGLTAAGFPWIGAGHPGVVITEYSDYECPYCRRAHEIVREVVREHKDHVQLVHVQMPLDDACNPAVGRPFHQHACRCALAAICAERQASFWPMNDLLFVRRCRFEDGALLESAATLGIERGPFRRCLESDKARAILRRDLAECERRKLRPATPTFALGDKVVVGLKDKAWWTRAVEERLAGEHPSLPKQGSP